MEEILLPGLDESINPTSTPIDDEEAADHLTEEADLVLADPPLSLAKRAQDGSLIHQLLGSDTRSMKEKMLDAVVSEAVSLTERPDIPFSVYFACRLFCSKSSLNKEGSLPSLASTKFNADADMWSAVCGCDIPDRKALYRHLKQKLMNEPSLTSKLSGLIMKYAKGFNS